MACCSPGQLATEGFFYSGEEDEVKLATMEMAWDKWRDKFKDDQLRPIVSIALTSSVHFSDQKWTGI